MDTVANVVPLSAPPPAPAAMTPAQSYNLQVMKMQSELYANTNEKLAVGFETITALAHQLRSNCKEGANALGQHMESDHE